MPNYVSPGVYTIEKDISEYTPSVNTSIVGIVGFASKGPTNKATLITSQNNLIDTFGPPSENILGQGLEGALEILEQTNSLYFIRAAASTAAAASGTIPIGACPAVLVSGTSNYLNGWGVARPLTLRIQVYDNNGVAQFTQNNSAGKDFVIPAGTGASQAAALRSIIGGGLDSDLVGVFDDGAPVGDTTTGLGLSGAIVGCFAGSGAYMSVSACSGTAFNEASGVSALRIVNPVSALDATYGASSLYASAVKVYGATFQTTGTNGVGYLIESLYPGAGYNAGTTTFGTTSGNSITITELGSQNFIVDVNENGVAKETFKVSFVGSGVFIEDMINTGSTNITSQIIKGNLVKGGSDANVNKLTNFAKLLSDLVGSTGFFTYSYRMLDPTLSPNATSNTLVTTTSNNTLGARFVKLIQGAVSLAGGSNGDAAGTATDALVGTSTGDTKTGMQALDDPTLNIGIALVPGIHTATVQNNLITLAESTQNFMALVSPPYAIGSVQNALDWTNGRSSTTANSRTSAISSSYAAVYWPWVKVFSTFDGKDRWYDPAIFGARQMAYTDAVSETWFAPAGFSRGRLTKPTEVEVKLNQGDRDSLYSGGNIINPIVSFAQQGITIFGQRTAQRTASALDRINVRRLMIYVRKVILQAAQRYIFEPNDEFTWAQVEAAINPFLDDIRRRRGITEFRVICDETVNTPVRVDRNEMWTKVLIKPTKTAEVIIFEINLTNQSAQLGTL